MRNTRKIKVSFNDVESLWLLRGNLNGKVYLTEEGKKLLLTAVKEKRY